MGIGVTDLINHISNLPITIMILVINKRERICSRIVRERERGEGGKEQTNIPRVVKNDVDNILKAMAYKSEFAR